MARRARARKSSLTMPIVAVFVLTALVGSCTASTASCRQRIAPETVAIEESPATTDPMGPDTTVDVPVAPETVAATKTPDVRLYILNTNTRKFHIPDCDAIARIKEENRSEIQATRDEVLAMGYSPCSKCQ